MSSDDLIVLYGSQTGNAEEIARAIAADLEALDIDVGIMSMQSWIEANNVKTKNNFLCLIFMYDRLKSYARKSLLYWYAQRLEMEIRRIMHRNSGGN
jgi:menaquinone-dependent protoporphyrinogen IX oxidase